MEYRQLGKSGLKVPELCFGAGTFGAANEFFKAWSETTQEEANRIVDICMDAGMNLFDTADIYSDGESEKALGKALLAPGPLDADRRHELAVALGRAFPPYAPSGTSQRPTGASPSA